MKKILSIDAHCDTVLKSYRQGVTFLDNGGVTHIDIAGLKTIKPHIQFLALFCDSFKTSEHYHGVMELIDYFYRELSQGQRDVVLIENNDNLASCVEYDRLGIILAVEGAYLLVDNLHRIEELYRLGVRCISFTWNPGNGLSGGIGDSSDKGLTMQGKAAVKKINDLGMLIDVSHISRKGFWDIIELTDRPVIASHSNCLSICRHVRNLDDRQLTALGKLGGVIGVDFVPDFLGSDKSSVSGIADHIEHIIEKAGIDSVGLGSDFDGTEELPRGISGAEGFSKIYEELLKRGYGDLEAGKIMGGNFHRVIKQALAGDIPHQGG